MFQSHEEKQNIRIIKDRRSNPFIRTRQRRTFDRRQSFRVGTNALTFCRCGDEIISGTLKDISDTGACIELEDLNLQKWRSLTVGIPLIYDKNIDCEISWSGNEDDHEGPGHYGLKFTDLSTQERNDLRRRFLLDESLLLEYTEAILKKTDNTELQQQIKTFFLIDVRVAIEGLIDCEIMLAAGEPEEKIFSKCKATLDSLVEAGDSLDDAVNGSGTGKLIKSTVRSLLGHFIYQSTVFRRGFEKPRGYPGDYKMLEIVYNDTEVSEGMGKHIDRYGLNVPYSVAIRLRKDKMREILYDFINAGSGQELNILNLASGACREIREMLLRPIRFPGRVNLMCVDQDEEAIEYSRTQLSRLDNGRINVQLIQGNILKLEALEIGGYNSLDMVYSIGIADYLQDRMLTKIFKDCYCKLKPGGQLVIAYKDRERHRPVALDWYGDWHFIPRNEEELIRLIEDAMGRENISIDINREDSGVIFFAAVTKLF